jgi:hypothetical protein
MRYNCFIKFGNTVTPFVKHYVTTGDFFLRFSSVSIICSKFVFRFILVILY